MLEDKLLLSSRSFLGHFKHYSINIPVKILFKAETKIKKVTKPVSAIPFCCKTWLFRAVFLTIIFDF